MNSLGIYFGPESINVVELAAKKEVNSFGLPMSLLSFSAEEKVPYEIKMVALLKDKFKECGIFAKNASITLSGQDLIIRGFTIPIVPVDEIRGVLSFEARKHIPFKIEDMEFDYQVYPEKGTRKLLVLFVGIKKETLYRYISVCKQLGLDILSVEYAGFSILRLLRLAKCNTRGVVGIINADFTENDEANFSFLINGFPVFSRDILLPSSSETIAAGQPQEPARRVDKLKTEWRVSLDYYYRKFPKSKISKFYFFAPETNRADFETFAKDLGLNIHFVRHDKIFQKPFATAYLKAYGNALLKTVSIPTKIDLSAYLKVAALKKTQVTSASLGEGPAIFRDLAIKPWVVVVALLICVTGFVIGYQQKMPFQRELNSVMNARPQVPQVNPQATYDELTAIETDYNAKISACNSFINSQFYLTEVFDTIPRILPKGMWFEVLQFVNTGEKAELMLQGSVIAYDSSKELETVNEFASVLQKDPVVGGSFEEVNINSVTNDWFEKVNVAVTKFSITCKKQYKKTAPLMP